MVDLAQVVTELTDRGVRVEFVTERLAFDPGGEDAFATFQLHLLGAVAQLERSVIRERQREGIAITRAKGIYRGHARRLDADQVTEARRLAEAGVAKAKIARDRGAHAGCSTTHWPAGVPMHLSAPNPRGHSGGRCPSKTLTSQVRSRPSRA